MGQVQSESVEDQQRSLLREGLGHIVKSTYFTVIYAVLFGLVGFPWLLVGLTQSETLPGTYFLLTFVGLALTAGQLESLGEIDASDNGEKGTIESAINTFFGFIYYNMLILFATAFALSLHQAVSADVAVVVAIGVPIADIQMGRAGYPSLMALILGIENKVVGIVTRLTEQYHYEWFYSVLTEIWAEFEDIVPPKAAHLAIQNLRGHKNRPH